MGSILQEIRNPGEAACDLAMEVHVLFTDVPATLGALRTAAQLAQGLTARIRLLLVETIPFPRPLDSPARDVRFLERQFRTLVDSYPGETFGRSVVTVAEIVLCRDRWDALHRKLPQNSVIVIGKRSGWWPQSADRLAKKLRLAGHHVVRTSGGSSPALPQFVWRAQAHA